MNQTNRIPTKLTKVDHRTGPVGFKSWIDSHRGRLEYIIDLIPQKLEEMFQMETVFVLTLE